MFYDLREFIKQVEELGECRVIEGADWDLEIGHITELATSVPEPPLTLFDNIKGYPRGYRVASNVVGSPKRISLFLGLPLDVTGVDQVKAFRDKLGGFNPILPVEVSTGPIKENVHVGDEVDLYEFPTPKWHNLDGGRYIGTGSMVIVKDPDTGWVNLSTHRVQIQDKTTATILIIHGRHGLIIAEKYWKRGLSCPIAVVCGGDPQLWMPATTHVPLGMSEYDYAGWLRGEPVAVLKGETVDLPIPATAEIVLEGEFVSPDVETRIEGPFGEWEGYYGSDARPRPVIRVSAILHRNDPIIHGAAAIVGDFNYQEGMNVHLSGALWDVLDKQLPGVRGVWRMNAARGPLMIVISLKQQYPGHAKAAATLAAADSRGAGTMGRFIVIVDDDIDPSNISEVLWALGTRCDPETSIDIIGGCQCNVSDPMLSPEKKESGDITTSRAIIYACKPYTWIERFPTPIKSSPEVLRKVKEKWGNILFREGS